MHIVVTGGGGFIGSHIVERLASKRHDVLAIDSLARASILGNHFLGSSVSRRNWDRVATLTGVTRLEADVRDQVSMVRATTQAEVIVHTAAQVAVTASMSDPRTDFDTNVVGTANVLEGARKSKKNPILIFCSTNKVYGDHVNEISVQDRGTRYVFDDPEFVRGVPESMQVDHCHHSPYGVSKLAADLYVQEYARSYGIPTAVFRMSCIYGPNQFGMEDQGWVAHFALSASAGRPITIYGDGKQVRDVLFIDDLVDAFEAYILHGQQLGGRVYNMGGGPENSISILELLSQLEGHLNSKIPVSYAGWRPADQRVYISDIQRAQEELQWSPKISPSAGVRSLFEWSKTVTAALTSTER